MRLLFLNSVRGGGGGLRSALELANGLARSGIDVHVACNRAGTLHERIEEEQDIRAHALRIGPDYDPLATIALARVLRAVQPHVAIADRRKDVKLLVAARRIAVPFPIVHRHGAPSTLRDSAAYRFFWSRVQALVVNSHAMRAALLRETPWLALNPIEVIHNGVDTERFHPRAGDRAAVRSTLGIPADGFVLAFHGVLQARKRVPLLLEAAARTGAHVLIVGDGPDAEALSALARTLGVAATFTGPRTDVAALLCAADVHVHLSGAEGFSNSVLEALACGLPVLATSEHSHPEQVSDDCGLLVPPVIEEVARAIGTLRDDAELRMRLGAGARDRAERVFPIGTMIERYAQLLQRMVDPLTKERSPRPLS